jgi:hypothetical protein
MKTMIKEFYNEDLAEHKDQWCNDGLSASLRRTKMAMWAAGAWAIIREEADFLRAAFVSTGFLVAQDGSENHLIKIGSNYTF